MDITPLSPTQGRTAPTGKPDPARVVAERFETAFLAEMLKHTGINKTSEVTGGGAGEDAFSSFLTQEYARLITERGGIGLAEQIFNAIEQKGPTE
jgi:flagellar protein FlgJ